MAVAVDYARDVKPYDDDPGDWTDEEVATNLGGETFNAIRIDAARSYHFEANWWYRTSDETFEGAFQAIRENAGSPQLAKDVLKRIWEMIFGVSQPTYNTEFRRKANGEIAENQFGHYFRDFAGWAVSQGHITQAAVDDFIALAGGWKYPTKPTAADVAASRSGDAFYQSQLVAVNEVNSKAGNAMNAAQASMGAGGTPQEILDAADAAWNA